MEFTGGIIDYLVVFWAGVLVSFTPCLYPVMPITAAFIAGYNTEGKKLSGFFLSLLYVFGFAITYSSLGIFAALSGKVFGKILNHPYVFIIEANILLIFAMIMLDVIHMPSIGFNVQHKIQKKGILSVILFGMASALVVGPCSAPVLITLLGYVASKQNLLFGGSLLFVFSYGVGVSLILVGTFSGLLANLPKSGVWLKRIKQFCGGVLILIAQLLLLKAGGLLI